MKKTIVVTGGAGFVGSNLIEYLIKKTNSEILSIDDYSSGKKKNHIKNKKVKYINAHTKNISKILNPYKKKIKVIFHFGEFSRIYQSFTNYKKCFEYNIHHSSKVIEFAPIIFALFADSFLRDLIFKISVFFLDVKPVAKIKIETL